MFPFSNLRSYFDHQARNGPGNEKSAATPELTTIVDTPIFRQPAKAEEISAKISKYPKNHLPPNHKPDVSPSLEPPSASAAASPIVNYQPPPIPEQVLKAPDAVPPIIYGPESAQEKVNNERKKLQILPTFVSQIPLTVVGEKYVPYGGLVPPTQSQIVQGLPPSSIQNPSIIILPTAPLQNLQNPITTAGYLNDKIIQTNKEIPTKINKLPNSSYPKKWQPEKEKEAIKTKYPKGGESNLKAENSEGLKKERKQTKENQQNIGASSSYPKTLIPVFPAQAASKVPSLGEQVQRIIIIKMFTHACTVVCYSKKVDTIAHISRLEHNLFLLQHQVLSCYINFIGHACGV